ncbi:MAG: ribonuclease Y [Candidatus Lernaella stagnicola]|nr:ribonuclease Y [Candidatus Lernaella stagnicola]
MESIHYVISALAALVALGLGLGGGILLHRSLARRRLDDAENQAERIITDARSKAQSLEKEAELKMKDRRLQLQEQVEREMRQRQGEIDNAEKRLALKEENLERKVVLLDEKEIEVTAREKVLVVREAALAQQEKKYDALIEEWQTRLERVAGMSQDEAKQHLMRAMENDAKHDAAKTIREVIEEAKKKADNEAKKIISLAIQRYAGEYVAERTVSVVSLPNDDMKGRIIGREGRNIRALEAQTGVDFIVDDTPETVVLSCHNPVRREIARISLERLINDGRIHPTRIEEIVKKVTVEIDQDIQQAGEQATFDLGIHGIHPELVKLIGRLKYRTSYAQNILQHSLEVAFIAGVMAAELGQNVKMAKRAGMLHDIGKAVDHEVEGSHAIIGMDLARKYGEHEDIVRAIGAHHEEVKQETVLDIIVQSADALSGARPGARREMLESYVKRLEDLERIAKDFDGIDSCYAIQAGREIRIIVKAEQINDDRTAVLSRDVAKQIEQELSYPGQIRVTCIREHRAVEYAK